MRAQRAAGKRKEYEYAYYRRPEVRERNAARWRAMFGDPHPDLTIAAPYTGHRWFDMVRQLAGPMPDQSAPWADKYNDMVGEGVLALLEGRGPREAMAAYRKHEYIPEYRTVHFSTLMDKADGGDWERFLPAAAVPPQEEVVSDYPSAPEGSIVLKVKWHANPMRRLKAESRKGKRGPNRSYQRFRKHDFRS